MRMGVNTGMWTSNFGAGDIGLIEHARSLGAEGIEFARSGFDGFPVEAVRAEVQRVGMGCTLCTSPPEPELSIIHPSARARADGLRYLLETIDVAARIGAHTVCGLLYAKPGWFTGERRTRQELDWAVSAFRELGPSLERSDIALAIEPVNRWETFFLNTASDGVDLCDAIGNPRIGLLLDSAHMNIEEKSQASAIRSAARWLRHVHVAETDRGTPGTGQTDWPGAHGSARRGRLRRLVHDRELRVARAQGSRGDALLARPRRIPRRAGEGRTQVPPRLPTRPRPNHGERAPRVTGLRAGAMTAAAADVLVLLGSLLLGGLFVVGRAAASSCCRTRRD